MARLEVICGSMWSGKSEELVRRLRRHQIAGRKTILLRPTIDTRGEREITFSPTKFISCYMEDLNGFDFPWFEVIGIDEIQLFRDYVPYIEKLIDNNKTVIVSGLDMTYRREPFGDVPYLMATADRVDKLNAICHKCGNDAIYTQRLIDGEPAPFQGETILVGGQDTYEARCRSCFEIA